MKTSLKTYTLASLLAIAGVLSVGGCAATPTHDSTGEYVDDTGITTRVKAALLKDDAVKSFEIKVETMKGNVQLSGFVDTSDQKFSAGKDAAGVPGVTNVTNDLIVK
jgi:hyperosmotically inducible periplasmic protein